MLNVTITSNAVVASVVVVVVVVIVVVVVVWERPLLHAVEILVMYFYYLIRDYYYFPGHLSYEGEKGWGLRVDKEEACMKGARFWVFMIVSHGSKYPLKENGLVVMSWMRVKCG